MDEIKFSVAMVRSYKNGIAINKNQSWMFYQFNKFMYLISGY